MSDKKQRQWILRTIASSWYLLVDDDWSPGTCLGGQGPAPRVRGELLHSDDGGRGGNIYRERDSNYDPLPWEARVLVRKRTIGH